MTSSQAQGVGEYLATNARYASLLAVFRDRIAATVDFDRVEPREFWRRAVREALAESNYDANLLIDAMFDAGVNRRHRRGGNRHRAR